MPYQRPAVHRTIVVVDVEGFGNPHRANPHLVAVRDGLYRVLRQAFSNASIPWASCDHEDRGDGVFVLIPPDVPKSLVAEALPRALAAALRAHNSAHTAAERIRLRLAVHAGEISYDDHGVASTAVNLTFRLLEAPAFKDLLAASPGVLALIASGWFFDEVVRHSPASTPATYRPVAVTVKETTTVGWVCLPDHPCPPGDVGVPRDVGIPRREPGPLVPRQLPAHSPHFVGRAAELGQLTTLLDTATSGSPVVISAVSGTAGIGKTTLAVHWAHQNAARFPDGQLYADLRGFGPTGTPAQPAPVIQGFLGAFGVPAERIPTRLDAQTALYRSVVAGRRLLVVLDNARDAAQVRPLLPGSDSCLVVITSRSELASLAAREGARLITVDALTRQEATALLARHLGQERVTAEPDAIATVVDCCAGMPLALAIAAARAAANPGFPIATLADELRGEQDRLDALDAGDQVMSVRAVLSWSYRALTPPAARIFRLLGLHPGPDVSLHAAASLASIGLPQTRAVLAELTQAHLVEQHTPGRYRFHDLLRAYAAERAAWEETARHQHAALHRALDFYLYTGFAAERHLYRRRDPIVLATPRPGVSMRPITGYEHAMDWFTAEHATLLAVTSYAARAGFHRHAWQLPWILTPFLDRQGQWHQWAATRQDAIRAARRLGDRAAEAQAQRSLGCVYQRLGRYTEASAHLTQALAIVREIGDHTSEAHTRCTLGWVCERQGRFAEALTHAQHALRLYRATGHPTGETRALDLVGLCHARLGRLQEALARCGHALQLCRDLGDREAETLALIGHGYTHHRLGHHVQAVSSYQQALTVVRDLGDHYHEAVILVHLGDTHRAAGARSAACETWQQALAILDQLDHPEAHDVRVRLTQAGGDRP